jgi:hypothetical protein
MTCSREPLLGSPKVSFSTKTDISVASAFDPKQTLGGAAITIRIHGYTDLVRLPCG